MTHEFKIAEQIIGSLDDDGYLRRALQSIADDLAFKQSMWVEEKEIEAIIINKYKQFDPAGYCCKRFTRMFIHSIEKQTIGTRRCHCQNGSISAQDAASR